MLVGLILLLSCAGSAQTELSGKLEVIVEMPMMAGSMGPASAGSPQGMHVMGPPKLHFRLKLDDGRHVMLQGAGLDPSVGTGARLRVRGQAPVGAQALTGSSGPARTPVDFPVLSVQSLVVEQPAPQRAASRLGVAAAGASPIETRTVHIINAVPPGTQTYPTQDDPDSGIEQFFKSASYGKLDMKVSEYWAHDTWDDLSSCSMGLGGSDDLPPDAENADFVVYIKGCTGACYGILGGSASVCGAPSIHELGHNLGFQHANLLFCADGSTKGSQAVSFADIGKDPSLCTSRTYGDPVDVMGNGAGLNLIHRQRWLTGSELRKVSADGTFTIGDIADPAAPLKGLELAPPLGIRSLGPFFVEYHPGQGVALRLQTLMGNYTFGLGDSQLIYAIRTPTNPWASPQDPWWHAGDRFDDPISGLHLSVVLESASSAVVQVHYGALPTTPPADTTPPTVSILPVQQSGSGAGTVRVLVQAGDDVGVTKVEVYDGAQLLRSESPVP